MSDELWLESGEAWRFPGDAHPAMWTSRWPTGRWLHPSSHRSVLRANCGNTTVLPGGVKGQRTIPRTGYPSCLQSCQGLMVPSCARCWSSPSGSWVEKEWKCSLFQVGTECHKKHFRDQVPADHLTASSRKAKNLVAISRQGNEREKGPWAFRFPV